MRLNLIQQNKKNYIVLSIKREQRRQGQMKTELERILLDMFASN